MQTNLPVAVSPFVGTSLVDLPSSTYVCTSFVDLRTYTPLAVSPCVCNSFVDLHNSYLPVASTWILYLQICVIACQQVAPTFVPHLYSYIPTYKPVAVSPYVCTSFVDVYTYLPVVRTCVPHL